jgi:hypothetical protein
MTDQNYCDRCEKQTTVLFEVGYGNLECKKCADQAEIVEAYRAIQDRKMDEEAFSFMNADEQAYQISLGYQA